MTTLHQVRCTWSSQVGIDGVSTFYFTGNMTAIRARLQTFFGAIKAYIPDEVTITVPAGGNDIDDATGQVVGTWVNGSPTTTLCTGTGNYHAGAGAIITWRTGLFVGGREIRGKTFIVPVVSGGFTTTGTLDPATQTTLVNAANALAAGVDPLVIYSPTRHVNGAVTTASVPLRGMLLGSRRA